MVRSFNSQYLALFIRGLSLLLRAGLFVILAFTLSESDVGKFSIFQNLVIFSQVLIGLDIYAFYTRELIKNKKKTQNIILGNISTMIILNCFFCFSLFLLLDLTAFLNDDVILLFLFILFFESFNQEFYRIFIADKRQEVAYITQFLRSSFWIIILIIVSIYFRAFVSLKLIYYLWLFSTVSVFFLSLKYIFKRYPFKFEVNYKWIVSGLKVSLIYLLSSLSIKLLFLSDKLVFSEIFNSDLLGVYALYSSLGMGIYIITETVIFNFRFQDLIKFSTNNKVFYTKLKKFTLISILAVSFFTLCLFLIIEFGALTFESNIYSNNKNFGQFIVLAFALFTLNNIPHYFLYAKNRNIEIMLSNILLPISFFICCYLNFLSNLGIFSIPSYLMISICASFTMKLYFCMRYIK